MSRWDPERLERTTRDVNSIAAMIEVLEGRGSPHGGTYLSLTHLPKNVLDFGMREWLPTNISNYKYGGFDMHTFLGDLSENAVETAPACHFWNGGLVIDGDCRTTVDGLWAAGEGTAGIHGANRLSGNALTMTQVFGPRAGRSAAAEAKKVGHGEIDAEQVGDLRQKVYRFLGRGGREPGQPPHPAAAPGPSQRRSGARRRGDDDGGPRPGRFDAQGVGRPRHPAADAIYNQEWIECIQIENMLQCLEMVLGASRIRTESRGAAYRRDFPETNNRDWCKNIVIGNDAGRPTYEVRPVVVTSLTPPTDVRRYGLKLHPDHTPEPQGA